MKLLLSVLAMTTSVVTVTSTLAAEADPLVTIQNKWAVCQYESKDKDNQVYCLENLIKRN